MPADLEEDRSTTPAASDADLPADWRPGHFGQLMRRRIQQVLLVASPYDRFTLEEDGLSTEVIAAEYMDLGLTHCPTLTCVSTGQEALRAIEGGSFDLVVTLLRLGDMDVARFATAVRELRPDLPVVLLIANEWELAKITRRPSRPELDGVYVWQGDGKIFIAIIKALEDRFNAEHDTRVGDVGVIILVEDSVSFRSSLLPIIYSELVKQTRAVMAEGLNHMDRLLRMAARPKVLVAETFEQAMEFLERFGRHVLGVISDVSYPRGGQQDPQAGIAFIRQVQAQMPDVPVLLQSSDAANWQLAERLGVSFLHKRSPTLLEDLRGFMLTNFGFGDFIFRLPDGQEVGRARDLRGMREVLRSVPIESIIYHARHNHFSNWFRARTEFALARRMRPRRVSEFADPEHVRHYLISGISEALRQSRRGVIEDFSRERFDAGVGFARIGGGSLGGKARGLAFLNTLLVSANLSEEFPGIHVYVPRSVVVGTDVFDEFLGANRIRLAALEGMGDESIRREFLAGKLPGEVVADLRAFLAAVRSPLAVRSSSLLEDSRYRVFAGLYETRLLANNHPEDAVRLEQLMEAIKLVYASTFCSAARKALQSTPYRAEQEKMAVILQPVVGSRRGDHYYPNISGLARSYNYYPFGPMRPEDGVAMVALGLGKTVADGGPALRFCPARPRVLPQLGDPQQFINQSQRSFYAVDLRGRPGGSEPAGSGRPDDLVQLDLAQAERDGTLDLVGSVWSPDEEAFYDGVGRAGIPVVSFAPVLKSEVFPLARLLQRLLALGQGGMNSPIEIEFAADLAGRAWELAVLQMRPTAKEPDSEAVQLDELSRERMLCYSPAALGNGVIAGLNDVVYVRPGSFDPARVETIARQIAALNNQLATANRAYVLIGPGRWGSSHNWMGIPVQWEQVSGARVIVETALEDREVEVSRGSHFFQDLTTFGVAYLTVDARAGQGFIDWNWLEDRPAAAETEFVRHLRLTSPLEAHVDGLRSQGAILKPPGPAEDRPGRD